MYQINNRKEAIKEIQTALFKLGYGETHLVAIDGIWGENTRCAILHFQRENKLLVTGIVDYETFTELMKNTQENKKMINPNPFPLKEGDENGLINQLHALLNIIMSEHQNEHIICLGGSLFNECTKGCVNLFLARIGDEQNGEMSAHQFERLKRECNSIIATR